jgi:hypothetical protein
VRNLMQSRIWLANGYLGELPIICNKLINNDYCVTEYGDIYNHVFGRLVVKTRVMKLNCNQFKSHKCQKKLSFGDMWSVILVSQGFLVIKLKSSLRMFYVRHHDLGYPLWNISATRCVTFVVITTRSFLHSWLIKTRQE